MTNIKIAAIFVTISALCTLLPERTARQLITVRIPSVSTR